MKAGALAILGGVFDPIHLGHLAIAKAALAHLPVSEVRFLPAGTPPHKGSHRVSPGENRLRLLEIALAQRPEMTVDLRELRRAGPSWSVDTFRELALEFPEKSLFLLVGADNVELIGSWKEAEELLKLCIPVVASRSGNPRGFEAQHLPGVSRERLAEIQRWQLPAIDIEISSSDIRRRCAEGRAIDHLVPTEVARFIEENALYAAAGA